jgi:hypothetical protein
MNTQLLSLKVIDNTPAFVIGMRIAELSRQRQEAMAEYAKAQAEKPQEPPVVKPKKTEEESRIQHRDHMRRVRGSDPNYGNQTHEEHLRRQRECMARLRAERRGKSIDGMPKRQRVGWKQIISNI